MAVMSMFMTSVNKNILNCVIIINLNNEFDFTFHKKVSVLGHVIENPTIYPFKVPMHTQSMIP